ncbi:MAG TPA: penicillin-binding protein 2, partial [Thermoleophilaceae bacterium]|nr:penicillin-binding protein 2 [Thermoleophilaceae bacterium]
MYLDNENRPAITPQLALRVAIIGGIALVGFAIIFFRLWYLQVLSGDKYLAQARNNQVRDILVQAPRGNIVDRNGNVLVDNRIGYAVTISPDKLPKVNAAKTALYQRLSHVLNMPDREIRTTVRENLRALPFANVTVKSDVRPDVYSYIRERQTDFPGVSVLPVYLRRYPNNNLASQIVGWVGQVTAEQLKKTEFKGVNLNDRVGQAGIESAYDRYLRGADGATRVQVDASGALRGTLTKKNPVSGRQLRLTLNLDAQRVGEKTLDGRKGAFVAMDVRDGSIYAMGSAPTFNPNVFSKGVKTSTYKRLTDKNNGAPLANRAIQGLYPTGSTFKPITAVAALECGVLTPTQQLFDNGEFKLGPQTFQNAGHASYGLLNLPQALTVSSDVFFYQVGQSLDSACGGTALQKWGRKLGISKPTGIDIPGEGSPNQGFLPTPAQIDRLHKKMPNFFPIWTTGQAVQLAVGQGFVQADPLQMAVAYGGIATNYKVKPHLGLRIDDSQGRAVQEFATPARTP